MVTIPKAGLFQSLVATGDNGRNRSMLKFIRELDQQEIARIEKNKEALRRFGPNWGFAKFMESLNRVPELMKSLEDAAMKAGDIVNTADLELLNEALLELATATIRWTRDELRSLTASSGELSEETTLRSAIETIDPLFSVLSQSDGADSLVEVNLGDGAVQTTARISIEGRSADLWDLLGNLNRTAQEIAAASLRAHRGTIESAARELNHVASEVLLGTAVYMSIPNADEMSNHETTIKPTAVLPDEMIPVVVALENAINQVSDDVPSGSNTTAEQPGEPAGAQQETADDPTRQGSNDGSSESASETGWPLADIAAAVREASSLAESLEKRWSEAVLANGTPEHDEVVRKWMSLLVQVQRHLNEEQAKLSDEESSQRTVSYPIDLTTIEDLSRRYMANQGDEKVLGQAQVVAATEFMHALDGLQKPSTFRLSMTSGITESWWTAGAFSLVANRGQSLIRTNLASPENPSGYLAGSQIWLEDIGRAQRAFSEGLPEAAIIYCCRAVCLDIQLSLSQALDYPSTRGHALSRSGLAELETSFVALAGLSRAITEGASYSVAAVVCLASFWSSRLAWEVSKRASTRFGETS